jgi:hypothetical protein
LTNFPTSVDAPTNPTEFQRTNETGIKLHELITNLNDAVVAIENYLLNGAVGTGTARLKDGFLWLKDTSGGGTPWHKIYLELDGSDWVPVIDQVGQA